MPAGTQVAGSAARHVRSPGRLSAEPIVSVVMPMYNAADCIGRSLASVLAQTLTAIEVILIDDGSGDGTADLALARLERHQAAYTMILLACNRGPARARNLGVAAARAKYVAFIDADDEWFPDKLERQVALMEADARITVCGCQALWVNVDTGQTSPLFANMPELLVDGWKSLLWNCYVATPCALVRRDDLGIQPFSPALRVGEDRHLWISLASNGHVALVPEPMVRIRICQASYMARHATCIITDTLPMIRMLVRIFSDHLTWRERCRAIGSVYSNIGKSTCRRPAGYLRAAGHLLRAAIYGHNPVDNLRFALLNAPGVHRLRAALKHLRDGVQGRAR